MKQHRSAGRGAVVAADAGVSFLARYRSLIAADMWAAFEAATERDPGRPLYDILRYHLGWLDEGKAAPAPGSVAGKLLRPSLLLLSCEALGGQIDKALPAATAVEFVHGFTLIHDDIEDRSELRHGRPSVWRRWGVPLAVNAGDGLWAMAQLAAHRLAPVGVEPGRALAAMGELDRACLSLCEGQDRDIRFEGDTSLRADDYRSMVRGKTGALMAASAAIGALIAGADEPVVDAFREFGMHTGVAFQIRDDALGVWGETGSTGKERAEDLRERKLTYPVVFALQQAGDDDRRRLVERYARPMDDEGVRTALGVLDRAGAQAAAERLAAESADAAVDAIRSLPLDPARRDELAALARHAANRPR